MRPIGWSRYKNYSGPRAAAFNDQLGRAYTHRAEGGRAGGRERGRVPQPTCVRVFTAASLKSCFAGLLLSRLPAIPNGALCFFSSYSLMERAVQRWQGVHQSACV